MAAGLWRGQLCSLIESDMVKHSWGMALNLNLTSSLAPARRRMFGDIVCAVVNSSFRMTLGFS